MLLGKYKYRGKPLVVLVLSFISSTSPSFGPLVSHYQLSFYTTVTHSSVNNRYTKCIPSSLFPSSPLIRLPSLFLREISLRLLPFQQGGSITVATLTAFTIVNFLAISSMIWEPTPLMRTLASTSAAPKATMSQVLNTVENAFVLSHPLFGEES